MKFKIYLRQMLVLMKQNKLFSFLYVLGTGISVAMIVTGIIVFYAKIANNRYEPDRSKTLTVKNVAFSYGKGSSMSSTVLYGFAEKFLFDSRHIDKATLFDEQVSSDNIISLEGGNPFKVNMKCTDGRYWDFFPFKFIKGKGYSQDDIKMKLKRIVVSKTVAKRLFGDSDPVGKTVLLTYVPCIVSGVVEDIPYTMTATYADVYYASTDSEDCSGFVFFMRAKNKTDEELYVKELKEKVRKFNATNTDNKVPGTNIELEEDVASSSGVKINLEGQPDKFWRSQFRFGDREPDMGKILDTALLVFLVLLLVPALNLSGLVSSRMRGRMAEVGVRKAFGAPRSVLMKQILSENMMLTCIGGVIGLILSYILICCSSSWLSTAFDIFVPVIATENISTFYSFSTMFNPFIVIAAFLLCLLINLISAMLPAWITLKKPIVSSLNERRK